MPAAGQRLERTITVELSTRLLREALDVVEALDPPEDLRAEVFRMAATHAGQLTMVEGPVQVARNPGAFLGPS